MDLKKAVFDLADSVGVSGCETEAAELAESMIKPYCDEVCINNRGSVVGVIESANSSSAPVIHLDAHIDQIGLVITDIAENGFLKFAKCGGIDERTLSGIEVTVYGKEPVFGVISSIPPHLSKPEDEGKVKECSELAIDTGFSEARLKELVSKGDRAVLKAYPTELLGNLISARALDDRCGVAALIRTAEIISERKKSGAPVPKVIFTFSVCEEVGGKGSATAVFDARPDMSIAVDVSFARTPGCDKTETAELSKGPMIGYSPVLDHDMSDELKAAAEELNIPYQLEIMNSRTGTHADELTVNAGGIRTGLVSIPLKYMHTPVEVIDLDDVENTARLLAGYILSLGGAENA